MRWRRIVAARASMRPRRARLGCSGNRPSLSSIGLASMRPRRARLGCAGNTARLPDDVSICFNEAEARAPRMCGGERAHSALALASMRPRRARLGCMTRITDKRAPVRASMRPRRARLGCTLETWPDYPPHPRFNEAEARAPRMWVGLHVSSARQNASMRPRRARLGCPDEAAHAWLEALASMRPRRARLGCCAS